MVEEKAMNIVNPIKIESMALYNPNYSYLSYLIPGLIGFTLQMLIMAASVLVISSEFTHNTFHELVEIADGKTSMILLGKIIPHFIVHFSTVLIIVGVIFPLFDIRVYGSLFSIITIFTLFISVSLTAGLMISSLFHDQLFATEAALFFNTPAFIFSGFTFPLWGMPALTQLLHR
jgi:ABC-2 type transport system permease protein